MYMGHKKKVCLFCANLYYTYGESRAIDDYVILCKVTRQDISTECREKTCKHWVARGDVHGIAPSVGAVAGRE